MNDLAIAVAIMILGVVCFQQQQKIERLENTIDVVDAEAIDSRKDIRFLDEELFRVDNSLENTNEVLEDTLNLLRVAL